METIYCNRCGKEIKNVLPWLMGGTEKVWQCRDCFFVKSDGKALVPGSPALADIVGDTSVPEPVSS